MRLANVGCFCFADMALQIAIACPEKLRSVTRGVVELAGL